MKLQFSIIIPTHNRHEALIQCIKLLVQQGMTAEYEITISNDGQQLDIVDTMQQVMSVEGPKNGPAANRNNGARYAKGDWLIFIDDDCIPQPGLVKAYQNAIAAHPGVRAFEGAIHPDDWIKLKQDMAECPVNMHGGVFWTANVMIERKLFEEIGGFDEQFKLAAQEDQDIFLRIKERTEIVFVQDAIVVHPVRFGTLKSKLAAIPVTFSNWSHYFRKHHKTPVAKKLRRSFIDYQLNTCRHLLKLHPRQALLAQAKSWYALYLSMK